ncbi:MAG: DUF4124 domain-containing protein [Pseudomonadales bacterium]
MTSEPAAGPSAHRGTHWTSIATIAGHACLLAALLTLGAAPAWAAIYKTVDKDGNVVFSDVPPTAGEQGEVVEIQSGNTFNSSEARPATPAGGTAEAGNEDEAPLYEWTDDGGNPEAPPQYASYESLEIISPGHDESVRENAGNVRVLTMLKPELQPGHRMELLLDGKLAQSGTSPAFMLQNVDRGTHTVQVRVVSDDGMELVASAPTTFHLQRHTILLPKKQPAPSPKPKPQP